MDFSIDEVENINTQQAIYIFDHETQKYHNLKNQAFEITLTSGVYGNRFSLRFSTKQSTKEFTNNKDDVRIFYSQTTGILNISSPQNVKSVALYNILGQMVDHWEVANQSKQTIELIPKNLKTGVYLVKIKTDIAEKTQKIRVE